MEIVIKIPKKKYNEIKERTIVTCGETFAKDLVRRIRNGTPLPEHHGRLIDADWIKNTLDIYVINEYNGQFIRRSDIDTIPTIIEGSESE